MEERLLVDVPGGAHGPEVVPLLVDAEGGAAVPPEIGGQVVAGVERVLRPGEIGHGPAHGVRGGALPGALVGIADLPDAVVHEAVSGGGRGFPQDLVQFQAGVQHDLVTAERVVVGDLVHVRPVREARFVLIGITPRLEVVPQSVQRLPGIVNVFVGVLVVDLERAAELEALENLPVCVDIERGLDGPLVVLVVFAVGQLVVEELLHHPLPFRVVPDLVEEPVGLPVLQVGREDGEDVHIIVSDLEHIVVREDGAQGKTQPEVVHRGVGVVHTDVVALAQVLLDDVRVPVVRAGHVGLRLLRPGGRRQGRVQGGAHADVLVEPVGGGGAVGVVVVVLVREVAHQVAGVRPGFLGDLHVLLRVHQLHHRALVGHGHAVVERGAQLEGLVPGRPLLGRDQDDAAGRVGAVDGGLVRILQDGDALDVVGVQHADGRNCLGHAGHLPGRGACVHRHAVHHPQRGAGTVQGGLAADPDVEPVACAAAGVRGVLDAHTRDEALQQVVDPRLGLVLKVRGVHLKRTSGHILPALLDAVGADDQGVLQRLRVIFHLDVDPGAAVHLDGLRLEPHEGEHQLGLVGGRRNAVGAVLVRNDTLIVGGANDRDAHDRLSLLVRHRTGYHERGPLRPGRSTCQKQDDD